MFKAVSGSTLNYFYSIPFEGKYIIYRPLLHAAFIGNQTMAELAVRYVREPAAEVPDGDREAYSFMQQIGFLAPDPPPPAPPELRYKPATAVLLLTNRCNLRCTYCYADAGAKKREEMPFELAKQAIDVAARNAGEEGLENFELVFHGGGEPTVHWEVMIRAVEYARSLKPRAEITMSSNGVWSDRKRRFILDNFDGVSLSFDGMQELQDAQRPKADGSGSFKSVMKNIKAMEKKKFPYNIRITISSPWLEKLPATVESLCRDTGCQYMQVEPAFGTGREGWRNPTSKDAERFIAAFIEAMDVAESHHRNLMYSGARPWTTVCTFCTAAETALVVRPDGRLVSCYEVTDSKHQLENIFAVGRLEPNGPTIDDAARQRLARMRQERFEFCQECFCVWHCAGDCSSRCFSEGDDAHLRFEQRCRINREISKEILARYIESSGGVWKAKVEVSDPEADRPSDKG